MHGDSPATCQQCLRISTIKVTTTHTWACMHTAKPCCAKAADAPVLVRHGIKSALISPPSLVAVTDNGSREGGTVRCDRWYGRTYTRKGRVREPEMLKSSGVYWHSVFILEKLERNVAGKRYYKTRNTCIDDRRYPMLIEGEWEREKIDFYVEQFIEEKRRVLHLTSLYVICLWLYGRTRLNDGTTQVIQTSWRASRHRVFIDWRHLRGWNELNRRAILRNEQHVHLGKIRTPSTNLPHPSCRCRKVMLGACRQDWRVLKSTLEEGAGKRACSVGLDEVLTERREKLDCSRGEIQFKKDRKAELKAWKLQLPLLH